MLAAPFSNSSAKQLLGRVMQYSFPAGDSVLEVIALRFPSQISWLTRVPKAAFAYDTQFLVDNFLLNNSSTPFPPSVTNVPLDGKNHRAIAEQVVVPILLLPTQSTLHKRPTKKRNQEGIDDHEMFDLDDIPPTRVAQAVSLPFGNDRPQNGHGLHGV